MPKTIEQRIAYIEKLITDFFRGSEKKTKSASRSLKGKGKKAVKSGKRKLVRKSSKKSRQA